MSLKTLLKRVFTAFDAVATDKMDKLVTTEQRLKHAARKISDEIRRLEGGRLENIRESSRLLQLAADHEKVAETREAKLVESIARGVDPARSQALVVLQRRRLSAALKQRSEDMMAANEDINNAIIILGDRLEEIQGDLELARIQQESNEMGLSLSEDVNYSVGIVNLDVDAILREVKIADSRPVMNDSPTDTEVNIYLASLK